MLVGVLIILTVSCSSPIETSTSESAPDTEQVEAAADTAEEAETAE